MFVFSDILLEFVEASMLGSHRDRTVVTFCREKSKARWRRGHHSHMSKPGNKEKKQLYMVAYRKKRCNQKA